MVSSNGGIQYDWSTGQQGSSVSVTNTGNYQVTATNIDGCVDSSSIYIYSIPKAIISINGPRELCANQQAILKVESDQLLSDVLWNTRQQTQEIMVDQNSHNSSGYSVSVTDQYGCVSTSSNNPMFMIDILDVPKANGSFEADIYNPSRISFYDSSEGAVVWFWNYGDESSSEAQNPIHEYLDIGTFMVHQIVYNEDGCSDSTEHTIQIEEQILIPNVFSPNGDGINDVFNIIHTGLNRFELIILNRWGEMLWKTYASRYFWDGTTMTGQKVPEGTYYFVLTAEGESGKQYMEKGSVNLFR